MDLRKQCTKLRDVTHVKVNEFEYTWLIENFKFYHCKIGDKLQSPIFKTGEIEEFHWRLNLYPNGYNQDSEEYLSIYLELVKRESKKSVYLALFLVNRCGDEEVFAESFIDTCFQDFGKRVFPKFAERSFVLEQSNNLLPNGALTLRCKLYFPGEIVHFSRPAETFLLPEQMISKDYEKLFNSEKLSDVKLVIGDKEFNVHKAVLAARSQVFAAMFDHPMKEQQENKVEIEDVDYDTMKQLLHYIYTGNFGKEEKTIVCYVKLLIAADKYELRGLKLLCEDALVVSMTVRNVGELLNLADRYGADELKKAAMTYITNHAKFLANSKKFKADIATLSPLLAEMLNIFMLKL